MNETEWEASLTSVKSHPIEIRMTLVSELCENDDYSATESDYKRERTLYK